MLYNFLVNAGSGLISGAERYAGAHSYTANRSAFDHISIFAIIFTVLSVFIVVCVLEYIKEKNKDRY